MVKGTFPAPKMVHVGNTLLLYQALACHITWAPTIKTSAERGGGGCLGVVGIILNRRERNLTEKPHNVETPGSSPRIPESHPPFPLAASGYAGDEKALRTSAIPAPTSPCPLVSRGAPLKKKPPNVSPGGRRGHRCHRHHHHRRACVSPLHAHRRRLGLHQSDRK